MTIAEQIRAKQNHKEMTRRAIQTLIEMCKYYNIDNKEEIENLKADFEKTFREPF